MSFPLFFSFVLFLSAGPLVCPAHVAAPHNPLSWRLSFPASGSSLPVPPSLSSCCPLLDPPPHTPARMVSPPRWQFRSSVSSLLVANLVNSWPQLAVTFLVRWVSCPFLDKACGCPPRLPRLPY